MADVKPEPICWLWPGRVALGKLTLIVGDPGLGKSFLTLDLAARVSAGESWPDAPEAENVPGAVVLLSAEDDLADTIRPRLDAAGADVARIVALSIFSLQRDLSELEKAIREAPGVRLAVIDPITAYLAGTDSHKNAEVRSLLAPLAELAGRHHVAVVAVSHLNKNAGGAAMYRAQGSLAFTAAARAVWLVAKDKADEARRLLLPIKSNLAREPSGLAYRIVGSATADVGRVEWEPDPVNVSADEVLSIDWGAGDARTDREDAADWLREALADGAMPAKDLRRLADQNGYSWATIRRAKGLAGVEVKRHGFGPGASWTWELADHRCSPGPIDAHPSDVSAYGGSEHLWPDDRAGDDPEIEVTE